MLNTSVYRVPYNPTSCMSSLAVQAGSLGATIVPPKRESGNSVSRETLTPHIGIRLIAKELTHYPGFSGVKEITMTTQELITAAQLEAKKDTANRAVGSQDKYFTMGITDNGKVVAVIAVLTEKSGQ